MFDADADVGREEVDGVFGDELLEGDEEGGLQGGRGADDARAKCEARMSAVAMPLNEGKIGGEPPKEDVHIQCEETDVEDDCDDIRKHRDDQDELPKLHRPPGALEISAAIENDGDGDDQGEGVALGKGRGEEGPGVEDGILRHERDPVEAVHLQSEDLGGDGDEKERGEEDACQRGDRDPELHGGVRASAHVVSRIRARSRRRRRGTPQGSRAPV